jgi:hypothetical protein
MKKRIQFVHPVSLALSWMPLFAVFGLIIAGYNIGTLGLKALITLIAVVAYPILGAVALLIGAVVYNLTARWTGGVLVEFSDEV